VHAVGVELTGYSGLLTRKEPIKSRTEVTKKKIEIVPYVPVKSSERLKK
jgi:hypothetical protein